MKRAVLIAALMLALLSTNARAHEIELAPAARGSPPTPAPAPRVAEAISGLNLRAGPGTAFAILRRLPPAAALQVSGRNAAGDWLAVASGSVKGWVAARYVTAAPADLPVLATPSAPATAPAAASPLPAPTATPAPAKPAVVVLGPETEWPVRAERIIGQGYEFVDASERYDLLLHRDVYGLVARALWGEALYELHPDGLRITLIDPVWDGTCPSPVAPLPLFAGSHCLLEGFGDGAGSLIYVGCAVPAQHHYSPQECFIAIAAEGEHLSDIVLAATITGPNMILNGYRARTPDFTQWPFTLLGAAHRVGDQWRWQSGFVEVVGG